MTTPTSNPVPSNAPQDLLNNSEVFDGLINNTSGTVTNRKGAQLVVYNEAISRLGWYAPVAFASGLAVTNSSFTVIDGGNYYFANPTAVPFTTTATFNPAQWRLFNQEFAGAEVAQIGTYSLLRAYAGTATLVYVAGRLNDQDGAAGMFAVDEADTTSADNGGTILVDAIGRRWKRQSDVITSEMFGIVTDGSDYTSEVEKLIDLAVKKGKPVKFIKNHPTNGVKLSRWVARNYTDTAAVINIDWGGVRLLPDYLVPNGTINMGAIELRRATHGARVVFNSINFHLDNSAIPRSDSVDAATRRGQGGLLLSNFGTINEENYYLKHCFYASGAWRGGYHTWNLTNCVMEDVGCKFNPLVDTTAGFDSAGDAFYFADLYGYAKTTMTNIYCKSYSDRIGRAGMACDAMPNCTSHIMTWNNTSFDGYHRVHHQEDGGLTKLVWNTGSALNFGCLLFGLVVQGSHQLNNVYIDNMQNQLPYGGNSGVVVTFAQTANSNTPEFNNCQIRYRRSTNENGNARYNNCSTLVDGGLLLGRVASDIEYSGGYLYLGEGSYFNHTSGSVTINSKFNMVGATYVEGFVIQNGYFAFADVTSTNIFTRNNAGVSIVDTYNDTEFYITSGAPALIFTGTSHRRRFDNVKIINNVISNPVEIAGTNIATESISGELKDVRFQLQGQNVIGDVLTSLGLTVRISAGSATTDWINKYASYGVFNNLTIIDAKGTIPSPVSDSAVLYKGQKFTGTTWTIIS